MELVVPSSLYQQLCLGQTRIGGKFIIIGYELLSINLYPFSFRHSTFGIDAQCMAETWYLACDMQMFLVSPLFIYLLWRWRNIGIAWSVFNILAYISGTIALYIIWDLPPMRGFTRPFDFKLSVKM